ncbi:MAG TPA: hypothetical protein PLB69_02845 [Smithellaceae bacterium]|jgi:hypothetical protein|nr:hypothetical protein [Smithellaceae bacterium]
MKKYFVIPLFLFIIFLPVIINAQTAESGTINMDVQGSVEIENDNVAIARGKAIQDVLEKAILEVICKLPEFQNQNEDFQLIKNILLQSPHKYVPYYTIKEEGRNEQVFALKANVVVSLSLLKNDLHKMGFIPDDIDVQNKTTIILTFKELKSYPKYLRIKNFLRSQTKVIKVVYPVCFAWQEARFELDFAGSAQVLADELKNTAGCLLEINESGNKGIEMVCRQ